ncbi:MAG: (2Fe-2S) ferredoxin domain-containing protein [Nitrospiria bacterium]
MPKYQYHIFNCVNERSADDPKGCCAARGAKTLQEIFKKEIYARGLKKRVRANKAGCLDECSWGPVVVIYPEGIWYSIQNEADVMEIIDKHIENGEVVKRLLIKE